MQSAPVTADAMHQTHTLPADVHRCPGSGSGAEGWREGCEDCMRRTSPPANPDRVWWMAPPPVIAFWCEAHIPGDTP